MDNEKNFPLTDLARKNQSQTLVRELLTLLCIPELKNIAQSKSRSICIGQFSLTMEVSQRRFLKSHYSLGRTVYKYYSMEFSDFLQSRK